jgi:hypothetical protein
MGESHAGAHRRDEHQAPRAGRTRRPGEGDHMTEIHAPKGISAARGLDGGAERTECAVGRLAQTRYGCLDRIEIGDHWSQLRMLDAELVTADGNDLPVTRISEESSQ